MAEFVYTRRVEFCETDLAGIVHFSNFYRYMEAAEHAYLRSCGLSVMTRVGDHVETFPRVSTSCEYFAPARFEDVLEIRVTVEKMGTSSVTYVFDVARGETKIARGRTVAVYCRQEGHALVKMAIPDEIRQALTADRPAPPPS